MTQPLVSSETDGGTLSSAIKSSHPTVSQMEDPPLPDLAIRLTHTSFHVTILFYGRAYESPVYY
ncbi:MAG: hypothetical protein ACK53Y_09375, partial [bacterium]